jgi:hypothetical protein
LALPRTALAGPFAVVLIRKEVIGMKYEAPAIVELSSAIEAVQGSTQKTAFPLDLEGMVTVSAYQSDEA